MTKTITPSLIEKLYQDGTINEETRLAGQTHLQGPRAWGFWCERLCLCLGTTLILASIMFFFAYNWENLGKFLKFALIEVAIILCLASALFPFKAKLINQTLTISASFLIGVLLALIGQTYQTGANAWQLFAVWAVVIVPWVALSKFAPHWALWLTILHLALGFWMQQTMSLSYNDQIYTLSAHALLNGAALTLLLYARQFMNWLQNIWTLRTINLVVIVNLCTLSLWYIFSRHTWLSWPTAITALVFVSQAYLFHVSRYQWKDFIIHALLIIALAIQFESIIIELVNSNNSMDTDQFATMSILTIALFTGLVIYLRAAHQKMEAINDQ